MFDLLAAERVALDELLKLAEPVSNGGMVDLSRIDFGRERERTALIAREQTDQRVRSNIEAGNFKDYVDRRNVDELATALRLLVERSQPRQAVTVESLGWK